MKKNLIYDVGDRPKFWQMLIFAMQQVLAILAATIAVPTIIKLPTEIPAAILGAGIGTLIYQLFTRFKSPVFLGSSFAFLSSLGVALLYGYCGIIIGSIVAAAVYVFIAIIIRFVGTSWVDRLMPPVIIGPTVALIGLSLAVNAMGDIVAANSSLYYSDYNLVSLFCGMVAFVVIVICSTQKRIRMARLIPFIIGIVAGYATAALFTLAGHIFDIDYFMIIDFAPIVDNFIGENGAFKGISAFVQVPHIALYEAIREVVTGTMSPEVMEATEGGASILITIKDKAVDVNFGAIAEVVVAFLPVALVVFAEHIADHKNLSSIIEHDLIKDPGLDKTLLGDGVGSAAGTLFGICPNTTYGESVGCVAITKNASVVTITTTALMCIALSFFSPAMALLRTIPDCVMGGVCLTLYGFIAVSGLKMFKDLDLNNSKNLFVIASILISGIGKLIIKIPYAISDAGEITNYIEITSIATALIIGILTNTILTGIEKSKIGKEKDDK